MEWSNVSSGCSCLCAAGLQTSNVSQMKVGAHHQNYMY